VTLSRLKSSNPGSPKNSSPKNNAASVTPRALARKKKWRLRAIRHSFFV
jgi:hypothetical protein